jgi:hypothetical protein
MMIIRMLQAGTAWRGMLRGGIGVAVVLGSLVVAGGTAGADPASRPLTPTGVVVAYTPGASSAGVSWNASGAGNPVVNYYTVYYNNGVVGCAQVTTTSCTIVNLTPGALYTFNVVATNNIGNSPSSGPTKAIQITNLPSAVTNLAVHYTDGSTSLSVTWSAPLRGYPSAYTYQVALGSGGTVSTSGLSVKFINLVPGTSYTAVVFAVNSLGDGTSSSAATVTITGPPGAVTNVRAGTSVGAQGLDVTWGSPLSGYPAPRSYTVVASPGSATCTVVVTHCSFSKGLVVGVSYTFSVTARNPYGQSPAVVSSPATFVAPPRAPGAPTFSALGANARSVTLHWTPSSACGGSCAYDVFTRGRQFATTSKTRLVVSGLVYGTSYTFSIRVETAGGASALSAASRPVTAWRDELGTGQSIPTGVRLYSTTRGSYLEVTGGTLVVYDGSKRVWVARGRGGNHVTLTTSGDLVLYAGRRAVWSSGTRGATNARVSGGVALLTRGSRVLWRSTPVVVPPRGGGTPPTTTPVTPTTTYHPPVTTTTVPGVPVP